MMAQLINIKSIAMRMATEDDRNIPAYDHTRLSAVNTCPTWAAVRYGLHLKMNDAARSMALEAGGAAHEGFAAMRCFHLYHQTGNKELTMFHLIRNFGEERAKDIFDLIDTSATPQTNMVNVACEALYSSGFYDDPSDRNRTIANIEMSLATRASKWNFDEQIWIRDPDDNQSDVGIEIGFDIVVTITYSPINEDDNEQVLVRRFIGKLDGIHVKRDGKLVVCEDKTGSRLDDAWLAQWELSHQITGYCLASSTFVKQDIMKARVGGMRIPVAKDLISTVREEAVNRHVMLYTKWAEWFVHSCLLFEVSTDYPLRAPMYTTSCNRYFNACAFLPLCSCRDDEEKQEVLDNMYFEEWNPLHE